jgi:branched-chain amino acid aminotransferase
VATGPDRRIWRDGELIAWADATVHVLAASVQRGTLAFDVLRLEDVRGVPHVVGLDEHLERFLGSAGGMGMTGMPPLDELRSALLATVRANPGSEIVKISALWDEVVLDLMPEHRVPQITIAALSRSDAGYAGGPPPPVRLRLGRRPKLPASVLSPQWKVAASYTAGAVERLAAREAGYDDALLLDTDGRLAELPTQSFFLVVDGMLHVPTLDTVLRGITRAIVLEVAAELGVPVVEAPLDQYLLDEADEAFVSSTMAAVRPVAELEGRHYQVPGPISEKLADAVDRLYAGDHPASARWLTTTADRVLS